LIGQPSILLPAVPKNQIWLRSAEILQWGQEKIHVSFAFRRANVAARAAGPER
jgi:hypothetical protein